MYTKYAPEPPSPPKTTLGVSFVTAQTRSNYNFDAFKFEFERVQLFSRDDLQKNRTQNEMFIFPKK